MDFSNRDPLDEIPRHLTNRLDANLACFGSLLGTNSDMVVRKFAIGTEESLSAAIIYFENLVDKNQVNESILRPITNDAANIAAKKADPAQIAAYLKSRLATASSIKSTNTLGDAAACALSGETVLLVDGLDEAMVFGTQGWAQREVGLPQTEVTIRGPRESFVETLGTNIALLRRRISHPDLVVEIHKAGQKTRTTVAIAYLKGVIDDKIVDEIRSRLGRVKTDGILGAGQIEQFISDSPLSPFSTIGYSERPDVAAAKILEGRAAILTDGNPEALMVPTLFVESFQNPDDYNANPLFATLIRWIRYIAFGISVYGPAIFLALTSFHQELIPTSLFITLAAGVEGAPFPVLVEVIIMGLFFEIFREAGVRLPRPFGQGMTFVAALVVAQASIAIGLVGTSTVVVVAITAIASLVIPSQANASILIRLIMAILASIGGAYGILLGTLWLLAHMVSLRSFGVPYLAPVAPFNSTDFRQDVIFRSPLWAMMTRPRVFGWRNPQRLAKVSMPSPPEDDAGDSEG